MDAGSTSDEYTSREERRPSLKKWLRGKLFGILWKLFLALFLTFFVWQRIFLSIPPGHAGVLYRLFTGTQLERVYGPGLNIIPPWDTMFYYETRKQLALDNFEVLSIRGLPVHLELAIRYQPKYEQLGILHQRIGPDYANRVVIPQTQSVMRRELSRYTAEQIYTNAGGLLNDAIKLAREEVGRNYITAWDIVIRTISLPAPVTEAIENKLASRELLESYAFRLQTAEAEAERKRDEARGIRDYQARLSSTLSDQILEFEGIRAARQLATSKNAQVVLLGDKKTGLPLVPGGQ